MVFTGLDIQVFISVAVILGCAFIALLCDYYKGINERLREQALELAVRLEAQARAAAQTSPPPAPPPDLSVILAAISRIGDTIEATMRQSMREERAMERVATPLAPLAPLVNVPAPEVVASQVETALIDAIEPVLEPTVPVAVFEPVELAAPVVEHPVAAMIEEKPADVRIPAPVLSWGERPVEGPQIDILPLEIPELVEPPAAAPAAPAAASVVKIKVLRNPHPDEAPTLILPAIEEAVAPPPPPPPPPMPAPVLIEETPYLEIPEIAMPPVPEPILPEPILTEQIAALAEATGPVVPEVPEVNALSGLPKGFVDRGTFQGLLTVNSPFTGLVVSIGINEYESLPAAAAEKLVNDVEKLAGSLISSLTGVEHFACRSAEDEFILAFENESGPAAQRRLSNLSERLWDFQLRSLGSYSVVFSWGATEAYGEALSEAVGSASERMRETRMNRRSPAATSARPRLKRVVNA